MAGANLVVIITLKTRPMVSSHYTTEGIDTVIILFGSKALPKMTGRMRHTTTEVNNFKNYFDALRDGYFLNPNA